MASLAQLAIKKIPLLEIPSLLDTALPDSIRDNLKKRVTLERLWNEGYITKTLEELPAENKSLFEIAIEMIEPKLLDPYLEYVEHTSSSNEHDKKTRALLYFLEGVSNMIEETHGNFYSRIWDIIFWVKKDRGPTGFHLIEINSPRTEDGSISKRYIGTIDDFLRYRYDLMSQAGELRLLTWYNDTEITSGVREVLQKSMKERVNGYSPKVLWGHLKENYISITSTPILTHKLFIIRSGDESIELRVIEDHLVVYNYLTNEITCHNKSDGLLLLVCLCVDDECWRYRDDGPIGYLSYVD